MSKNVAQQVCVFAVAALFVTLLRWIVASEFKYSANIIDA